MSEVVVWENSQEFALMLEYERQRESLAVQEDALDI